MDDDDDDDDDNDVKIDRSRSLYAFVGWKKAAKNLKLDTLAQRYRVR